MNSSGFVEKHQRKLSKNWYIVFYCNLYYKVLLSVDCNVETLKSDDWLIMECYFIKVFNSILTVCFKIGNLYNNIFF